MSMLNLISKRLFTAGKFQASYSLLKVRRTATKEQIRDSYLRLCKLHHPDNIDTGNQRKFVQIQQAFERIKEAPLLDTSDRDYLSLGRNYNLNHRDENESIKDTTKVVNRYSSLGKYQSMLYPLPAKKFSRKLEAFLMVKLVPRKETNPDDEMSKDF